MNGVPSPLPVQLPLNMDPGEWQIKDSILCSFLPTGETPRSSCHLLSSAPAVLDFWAVMLWGKLSLFSLSLSIALSFKYIKMNIHFGGKRERKDECFSSLRRLSI